MLPRSITVFWLVAAPGLAAPVDPYIVLAFTPQQDVAESIPTLTPVMTQAPVALRVVDGRPGPDPAAVGIRTDDDDQPHPLQASNDIVAFVEAALAQLAQEWGVRVAPGADRVLEATIMVLRVDETNQAVGATFQANSGLSLALLDRAGNRLWSGTAAGDASRYGRAGSDANCNEVLSDALLEAFAAGLSQPGLQQAWAGIVEAAPGPARRATTEGDSLAFHIAVVTPGSSASHEEVVEPDTLLDELLGLLEQGFETETLLDYLDRKALSVPLSADDLARWKEDGIPEEVIRAALDLPVQ
ncbi:MAG: YajG family lipoprotein [Thermoanaerobaculia bacterium]